MSSANTSFEHVLHNLQERDRITKEVKQVMDAFIENIKEHEMYHVNNSLAKTLEFITTRIDTVFNEYKQTIDRFNIGIIHFISEYYSIADQNSDQFSTRSLHTYSGHRGHYNPILSANTTPNSSFDIKELVTIFQDYCYDFKCFKSHSEKNPRRSRERTYAIYQSLANYIASENVYDLADLVIREVDSVLTGVSSLLPPTRTTHTVRKSKKADSKNSLGPEGVEMYSNLKSMIQEFYNIKLDFKPPEEIPDTCECGNLMQVLAGSSEMICDNCGYLYELKGTVFSDEQFYSQEGTRYKHAGYEPSKHCKSWLERIQARETNTISPGQIAKIEACIVRDGITNKKRLSIEQLRRYLKDSGLTELNEHVALIKRIITGIVPPQLSYAETQDITSSFSKAVKAYNVIRPSNKSNMLFYPFIVSKLIEMHVNDYTKRKGLLSFIHLQGSQTLIQNDKIWLRICNATPGFEYKPTDRYEYFD